MFFSSKPKVTVHVGSAGECYPCATDESVLRGMLRLGRRGIPAGCVGGGCGVCKVKVVDGRVNRISPVSRAHVDAEEEAEGVTLACCVAPQTDVRIEIAGRLEKAFSRAAPAAAGVPMANP